MQTSACCLTLTLTFAAMWAAVVPSRAADAPPPLQYGGIAATTTLEDLQARFPGRMTAEWNAKQPGHRTLSTGTIRLAHPLGRATELSYRETGEEARELQLFFGGGLDCRKLLRPLRAQFGREQSMEQASTGGSSSDFHVWKRGEETMTLTCERPKRRSIVDRLTFTCPETCMSSRETPKTPLQYEGISARTTLADLQSRLPNEVTGIWNAKEPAHRTVSGGAWPLAQNALGRATGLTYFETEDEVRIIRLSFSAYNPAYPTHEIELSCRELLSPLREQFGEENGVEQYSEEAFLHVRRIWRRGNQSMTLDCGNLPKRPQIVDRLEFRCEGPCRRK